MKCAIEKCFYNDGTYCVLGEDEVNINDDNTCDECIIIEMPEGENEVNINGGNMCDECAIIEITEKNLNMLKKQLNKEIKLFKKTVEDYIRCKSKFNNL